MQRTAVEVPVASTKSTGFSVKTQAEAAARTVEKKHCRKAKEMEIEGQ